MLTRTGMTQTVIAEIAGCSQNAVSHALIKRGFKGKRGPKGVDADTEAAIVSMARNGVSYYEVERATGVNHSTASAIAIRHGIKRGKGGGCAAKANAKRHESAVERIAEQIGERFEIVEEIKPNWFVLRCREFGHEFDRFVDLNYPTTCPECKRMESERHAEEHELSSVRRALVRALQKVLKVKEREERERAFLDARHVCKECGREFTMRELRESNPFNYSDNPTFCSLSCSHRYHGREQRHKRRASKSGGECSISLRELDELCDHTCYICGRKTEWDDYRIDDSGSFVAGDMYPSIDHVIPIANGGTHTKDNLRIAHRICNSIKGDRSIEYAMEAIASRLEGVPS